MSKELTIKKLSLIPLACVLLLCGSSKGQQVVPNGSFELGTGAKADSWTFIDSVSRVQGYNTMVAGQPATFNATNGQYFIKLTTIAGANPQANARLGTAKIMLPFIGYPDSMSMQTAYFPKIQEDGYIISFELFKVDSATHQLVTAGATSFNGGKSDNWHRFSGTFFFTQFGKPEYDSLLITIQSASPGQHDMTTFQGLWGIGTVLLVDELSLYGDSLVSGISLIVKKTGVSVYPNPCKDKATILISNGIRENSKIIITDIQGRVVKEAAIAIESTGKNQLDIDLSGIVPGAYLGQLVSVGAIQTFKIIVAQ